MTLQLRVEDLAHLATELHTRAPGASIDVETLQPHNIRDRNGAIIGYLDLSMNEIVWHKETQPLP